MTHYPERHVSEAEAVVQEARALENETRRETEELIEDEGEKPACGRFAEDQAQYDDLLAAAETVVRIGRKMQRPWRRDPYSELADKISSRSKSILADIRAGDLLETFSADAAVDDKS